MAKFIKKNFWMMVLLVAAVLILPSLVNAAPPKPTDLLTGGWWGDKDYGLLACNAKICTSLCQLLELLNNLLYFGLTLLFYIIAPIRFIIGGFLIMVSRGNTEKLSKGISTIKGTAIGILIAFGGYAIVATFLWMIGNNTAQSGRPRVAWPNIACQAGANPYDLRFATTTITTSTGLTTGEVPNAPGSHAYNLAQLAAVGVPRISVTTTQGESHVRANCDTDGDGQYEDSEKPCTSLEGLPMEAILGLKNIRAGCIEYYQKVDPLKVNSCTVTVTAGTEPGHKSHGPGRPIVDIENLPVLDEFIIRGMLGIEPPNEITKDKWDPPYTGADGASYTYESNPSHWHIDFK